jgi:transcriptional regulator with XRE-family HTH domain
MSHREGGDAPISNAYGAQRGRVLDALGHAISEARDCKHMETADLAEKAGLDRGLVEAIIDGRHDPHDDVLLALARALRVKPQVLVRRAENRVYPWGKEIDAQALSVAFGRRLREVRVALGISQDDLAERTCVHTTAIGRMERGGREPRLASIVRLARGLGVEPGVLVNEGSGGGASSLLAVGERRLTSEEFAEHFGQLPTDGEG